MHYAEAQKWYYLKDQMPNEVFLLLQADSEGSTGEYFSFSHVSGLIWHDADSLYGGRSSTLCFPTPGIN